MPTTMNMLMRSAHRALLVVCLALVVQGCAVLTPQTVALRGARPAGLPDAAELTAVPFFPQEDYQCGPAALATILDFAGLKLTPEQLAGEVYLPERHGSLQVEMLASPRRHGMVSYELAPRLADVLREVAAGNPVVVLQDNGVGPFSLWHYAVIVGYDFSRAELYLRSGPGQRLVKSFGAFEYTWHAGRHWAMVALPPARIPETATQDRYRSAVSAMERSPDRAAARDAFAAFLARWPDDEAAAVGLANSQHALGNLREAEAVLRRAAAQHPDSVPVLNNLAQALDDQGKGEEALAVAERALRLGGPFQDAVRDTRDTIFRRLRAASGKG